MKQEHLDKAKELYYKHSKTQEALEHLDKALALDSNYKEALTEKANCLRFLGKTQEALEHLDKALALDSSYQIAIYLKIRITKNTQDLEKYTPQTHEEYFQKANALWSIEMLPEAILCFDKALEINPNDADALIGKGLALADQGKLEAAIEAYDKALEINPNYANALIGKGLALKAQGKLDEAIESYDKAISIIDNDSKGEKNQGTKALVYCSKGKILMTLNRNEEALEFLNKAHDLSKYIAVGKGNLSLGNISYIQKSITDDREQLIEKVRELQEKFINAKTLVDKTDDKQAKEELEVINQEKQKVADKLNTALENQNKLINVKIDENVAAEISRARTTEELDIINKLIEERQKDKQTIDVHTKMLIESRREKMELEKRIERLEKDLMVMQEKMGDSHHLNEGSIDVGVSGGVIDKNKNNEKAVKEVAKVDEPFCTCLIFTQNSITYDNPLLNHPDLLESLLTKYSLSQILDLSSNLDESLINEVLNTNDPDTLLAGLMSVDTSSYDF
jgi:tetratricopeptide (TPR) repeat protein